MAVKLVTDSTADIPRPLVEELGITVVPLMVHFGEKTYLDFVELGSESFYDLLRKSPHHPRTSQPAPGDFAKVYAELTADGSPVVSVHLSAEMSGTIQSATMGRDMTPGGRVEIVDSRMASMAFGLAVVAGARAARAGKSQDEVVAVVKDVLSKTRVFFAVDTLEYLARNGRIGKAQALLGNLLAVKPLLTLEDGFVAPFEKLRGEKKVMPRMIELMGEALRPDGPRPRVAIVHGDCLDRAEALRSEVERLYSPEETMVAGLGAVIGTHVGPGTLGLIWYQP